MKETGELILKNISTDDLKFKSEFGVNHGKYQDGYRIVYFFPDSTYKVGTFCGNIEGFMMDFVEMEPIKDENDIPKFISIDDLLDRYLNDVFAAESVAIYKTNGILIAKKDRSKINNYQNIAK